ncbi:hypothetical protein DICVIV_00741 [Dictyocaulus viviparus]|uniref:SAP domain-containing protein n=1 Tax=Dictyocaulus viviparus TaxID=29172 RepID=A0A0D8YEJ3_DICVI|nr:hypothetical protein DICVIV_00741 [Dictyocaulus viviparus]
MNSEADYQKMTIAHLKEELSKRGVTPDSKAKKSELIKLLQKLQIQIQAEEDAILNHSEDGGYGDPLSTPDEDLLNDDVLNDVLPEKLIGDVSKPIKTTDESKPQAATENEKHKFEVCATTLTHDPLALDVKLKRAQRFGLPIAVTDPIAKAKRAERFGISSLLNSDTKAKRAERFGLSKQASIPGSDSSEEEARKNKTPKLLPLGYHLFRFGLPVNNQGKTLKPSKDVLIARAERFGLKKDATTDVSASKMSPGVISSKERKLVLKGSVELDGVQCLQLNR